MDFHTNGISLFYEKTGRGPALFLLHGNGEDHHLFDTLVQQLKKDFTVYAVDSRNHGKSGNTDDFSYTAMAQDMQALISALAPGQAFLAGFSDGAILGLMLAIKHPLLLQKAALLGINLCPEDFKPENLEWLQTECAKTGDPLLRLMLEEPRISLKDAAQVHIPALVIGGEDDLFRETLFPELAAALPRGQLQVFPGETHDSYVQKAALLAPVLKKFFLEA